MAGILQGCLFPCPGKISAFGSFYLNRSKKNNHFLFLLWLFLAFIRFELKIKAVLRPLTFQQLLEVPHVEMLPGLWNFGEIRLPVGIRQPSFNSGAWNTDSIRDLLCGCRLLVIFTRG